MNPKPFGSVLTTKPFSHIAFKKVNFLGYEFFCVICRSKPRLRPLSGNCNPDSASKSRAIRVQMISIRVQMGGIHRAWVFCGVGFVSRLLVCAGYGWLRSSVLCVWRSWKRISVQPLCALIRFVWSVGTRFKREVSALLFCFSHSPR